MDWRALRRVAATLAVAAAVLFLLPLPRFCDPRREEVPPERYAELARFDGQRTRAEVEAALALVDPERHLRPYLTLDDAALAIALRAGASPAVRIRLRAPSSPPPPIPAVFRRIALDPGHSGGAWSRLEKRHVVRGGGAPVREGDLAWATARLVERDLRARGADVRLVRPPPPASPFPAGVDPEFDVQREAAYKLSELHPSHSRWLTPWIALRLLRERRRLARAALFELYTRYDLRRRAATAEAFAPDVTLSLHYDFTESDRNGILVFAPGNALADDLVTPSQRFWAFRRVLDGSLPITTRLATAAGTALMRHLDLPALPASHDAETGRFWRPLDPAHGAFARDLAILRRTPGPVLLLEGPCVNQTDEYRRLQATDLPVDGQPYPARIRAYADAVIELLRP